MMTPDNLPGFQTFIRIVIGDFESIIGFLVIFQSMYTAVMERTREIGILKSMGASKVLHRERGAAGDGSCSRLRVLSSALSSASWQARDSDRASGAAAFLEHGVGGSP
jgi:hypothetical protein